MTAFHIGHVYVVHDRGYLSFEGHYWPVNNYWVTRDGDCVHTWRKPHDADYHVTRDHSFVISWSRRWPFITVDAY